MTIRLTAPKMIDPIAALVNRARDNAGAHPATLVAMDIGMFPDEIVKKLRRTEGALLRGKRKKALGKGKVNIDQGPGLLVGKMAQNGCLAGAWRPDHENQLIVETGYFWNPFRDTLRQ